MLTEIFKWEAHNGTPSRCGLQIKETAQNTVVVVSRLAGGDNGCSITNDAENLALIVCRRFSINPDRLMWIEHYPWDGTYRETFDLVSFEMDGDTFGDDPEWQSIPRDVVDALVDEPAVVLR